MSSHRGSRPRGHWSEETGEFEAVRLGGGGGGTGRRFVRFWPVMGLLVISVASAWLVTAHESGAATGINFAGGKPAATAPARPPGTGKPSGNAGGATKPPANTNPGAQPAPPAADGTTQNEWGPVTNADRKLIATIHQAALWQRTASLDAVNRTQNTTVRTAAKAIATELAPLDQKAGIAARALGVTLPAQATREQTSWVAELAGKRGTAYDQTFADRFRTAQGKLFPLISEVRVSTKNEVVRALAQSASTTVLRGMTFVERTGLTDGSPGSSGSGTAPGPPANNTGGNTGAVPPAGNGADQGDLLPSDLLPGDTAPAPAPVKSQPARDTGGTGQSAPSADLPPLPSATSAATSPSLANTGQSLPGSGSTMWIILGMIGIAVMISLVALRGFARQ
jgi:putative membrane protein